MAITYSSAAGTIITSAAMNETLPSQVQQTGNNTIVVSNLLSVIGNGNIGTGTLGTGDSYFNRRIVIDIAGTPQERIVTADVVGTGTTRILTVHEDWDTNPVATTDTVYVYYELADIEEGGAGGGISFATRTGLWTLTRVLIVGNAADIACLSMHGGDALEQADRGTADSLLVRNNGYFRVGYYSGGSAISGGVFAITAATNDEPAQTFESGADVAILDSLIWAQVANLSQISNAGANVLYEKTKLLKTTLEVELLGDTIINSSIAGSGGVTEKLAVNSSTVCKGLVISDVELIYNTTSNVNMRDVVFVNVPGYIEVLVSSFLVFVNPVWGVTDYTDFTFLGTGQIFEDNSLDVIVQEADGTKLQNSVVTMYENLVEIGLFPLVSGAAPEIITDVNGEIVSSFANKEHNQAATVSYGGYALQVGKWLYLPFVAAQSELQKFNGTIVLATDTNLVETVQTTAITNGSGITWNEDTNPSEIIEFNTGSGTLVDGMIVTFSPSGAVGTITTDMSGDSVAGEFHLNTRDATAIANGDTFSRTGGTAGTFSGTYVNDSKQSFSIWIEGSTKSYQTIYEYLSAHTTTIPLSVAARPILEWGRDQQAQALYNNGVSFRTERSYSKGVVIVNGGTGTVSHFTADDGTTWTPPSTTTFQVTVKNGTTPLQGISVRFEETDGTDITDGETNASGIFSYADSLGNRTINMIVRKRGYITPPETIIVVTGDFNVPVGLVRDPSVNRI